jgi:hypothetical protein
MFLQVTTFLIVNNNNLKSHVKILVGIFPCNKLIFQKSWNFVKVKKFCSSFHDEDLETFQNLLETWSYSNSIDLTISLVNVIRVVIKILFSHFEYCIYSKMHYHEYAKRRIRWFQISIAWIKMTKPNCLLFHPNRFKWSILLSYQTRNRIDGPS